MNKNAWKNYRNRWIYLKGEKVKLRKYIYVSSFYMKSINRRGWHDVNHVQNYKNALNKYGFAGVKIYEDFFYRDIPLPENRNVWIKLAFFLAPCYTKVLSVKYLILKKFKR